MKPSLHVKESHHSSWCVTWPGPCHHRAPVGVEKCPPLPLHNPHLLSLITSSERGGETVRQTESRQRPCDCVSYGTDLVLMTPTTSHVPHSVPTLCHPFLQAPPCIASSWPVSSLHKECRSVPAPVSHGFTHSSTH